MIVLVLPEIAMNKDNFQRIRPKKMSEEIVGQVYTARQRFGASVRNVVFMGMGEPFDNFNAVIQAVRVLSDQRGLDIAQRYITLSTAGRVDGIEKMATLEMPHLKLAVSLNAPNDRLRSQLMPINKAVPLDRLREALMRYPLKKGYDIMVAYVLMPGVNDGTECARQLADWLSPLSAKVNLIPYNSNPNLPFERPTPLQVDRFREILTDYHISAFVRRPRGDEISAACGQLAWMESVDSRA